MTLPWPSASGEPSWSPAPLCVEGALATADVDLVDLPVAATAPERPVWAPPVPLASMPSARQPATSSSALDRLLYRLLRARSPAKGGRYLSAEADLLAMGIELRVLAAVWALSALRRLLAGQADAALITAIVAGGVALIGGALTRRRASACKAALGLECLRTFVSPWTPLSLWTVEAAGQLALAVVAVPALLRALLHVCRPGYEQTVAADAGSRPVLSRSLLFWLCLLHLSTYVPLAIWAP